MASKTILSKKQQELLDLISKERDICRSFYLTGGTALAEFYLHHRYSEDLDFFSEYEFDPQAVSVFWQKIKKIAGIKKVDFEQSFNRNLFFLDIGKEVIKTEFTYFPFSRIEAKKKIGGLAIDSLLDIAVKKIFTIYQKPRARDFIDLYFIIQKNKKLTIADLVKKAKVKFDWHIDPLQLGAQFMQSTVIKDYPRMIIKIADKKWQDFFVSEAIRFKKKIIE